ncbi:SCAN domain-containing protein 3-like [Diabrotica undecimpunctata]|uniref:SCAN domain-containing protein 3-like n=1 Tax=Diabrotica undecimpunctata TaxID=50387 RepID=UPI003B634788
MPGNFCQNLRGNIIQDEVRKRLPKVQGSEKLLFSCTSQIISSQLNNGKCMITYCKSHYHHDNEIRHLYLSKIDKNQVANKLLAGVSVSKILDKNRDHIVETDVQIVHLLTKKDIYNIKNSYGISISDDGRRNGNDAVSVDMWMQEQRSFEENAVIFYKKQAKSGKPHTIGEELILPAVSEVLRTVLHQPASDIIKKIPLSNNTIQRRIDEMSEDVERSLTDYLKTTEFSLQLDESTLPNNESLLLAYVRFIKSEKICQELLFVRTLKTDTKGKSILDVLEHYFPDKVNEIRSSALNDRLFRKLWDENDENFNRLLLHTEVRWLSKGTCLKRFYDLFDSVLEFFESKDDSLRDNLLKFKSDIGYLTDLYDKFNETNLQLQGDNLNLIKAKGTISSSVSKLNLYRQNLGRRQFHQFQNLSSVETNDEDILVYCQYLEALQEDFRNRFQDILGLIIPDWVLEPFSSLEPAELSLQEELIELSKNEELKVKFKNGYQEFWLQCQISVLYPALWAASKKFFIAFPSSYLAERGFSIVSNLLTKKRNRLSIVERGDLRLLMTSMEPNIDR